MKTIYIIIGLFLPFCIYAQTPLSVNVGPDYEFCWQTSITFQVNNCGGMGGTPPYTCSWYPALPQMGQPVTTTTTYCLYVTDAAGDTASDCMTITILQPPTITLAAYTICLGDTLTILPPYQQLTLIDWGDSSFSNVVPFDTTMPFHFYNTPQTALISITDTNGCVNKVYANIMGTRINQRDITICGNQSEVLCGLTTSSNDVLSANWTGNDITMTTPFSCPHINANAEGTYILTTVTSSGCTSIDSVHFHNLHYQVSTFDSTICYQNEVASIQILGGAAPYMIDWGDGDSTLANTINSYTHTYNTTGFYKATIEDSSGCKETISFVVSNCSATMPSQTSTIELYPNPVQDNLLLRLPPFVTEPLILTIWSVNGQRIFEQLIPMDKTDIVIPTTDLSKGMYYFKLSSKSLNVWQLITKE